MHRLLSLITAAPVFLAAMGANTPETNPGPETQPVYAQSVSAGGGIRGIVRSEGAPLEYVAVRVLSPDSALVRHAVTDSLGGYRITGLDMESGIVSYSHPGYETEFRNFTLDGGKELVLDADMRPSARTLSEVVVSGSPVIRSADGHIVAIPTAAQKKHSFGGFDLLSAMMIPGVSVNRDTGEVSALFGSATAYINGVKATPQEIRSLRARDITRVEYYDAPTGLYVGENAVVNFVVRTYAAGGYGEVTAQQRAGYLDGTYGFAGRMSTKETSLQLFGGYGLSEIDSDRRDGTTRYGFSGAPLTEHVEGTGGRSRSNRAYAQAELSNSNKRRTLRASLTFSRNQRPEQTAHQSLSYERAHDAPADVTRSTSTSDLGVQGGARLYGRFAIGAGQSIEVNTRATYTRNRYRYSLQEHGAGEPAQTLGNASKEGLWNVDVNLSYTRRFSRGNSLSVKFNDLYKDSRVDYTGTNTSQSSLWSNEEIVFVQYDHPLSKAVRASVQPGFSALQYRQGGRDMISIFSPRLSLRLNAMMGRNRYLMVSGAIGNSFPDISTLTTAVQTVNRWHILKGNPDIDNTKLYRVMGVYGYNSGLFSVQLMAQYQYNHSVPVASYTDAGSVILESRTTDEDSHYLNTNASVTFRPVQNASLQLSGGYNRYAYTGHHDACAAGWDASLSGMLYAGDFSFGVRVSSPKRVMGMDLVHVRTPWEYGCSVTYSRGSWRMEAGVDNPFARHSSYRFRTSGPVYSYSYRLISRKAGCSGFLKLSYSFDFGKKIKKDELKPEQSEIESSILKVK